MNNFNTVLKRKPLIYVTRDIERALGLHLDTPGYFIISNFTPFAKLVLVPLSHHEVSEAEGSVNGRKNVLLIKEKNMLDTWELLQRIANPDPPTGGEGSISKTLSEVQKRDPSIASLFRNGQLVVFKNTRQIEKICVENGWKLLNPPAKISNEVEEKIPQLAWLGPLKKYLPKYSVLKCKEIKFVNKPFILQFNRSHTGSGTILINNKKTLENIKKIFPERLARIAEYIAGPLFTNNNVVTNAGVMLGNISYQITGLKPFTNLPFSTIGNDWTLPHKILTKKQITQYKKIATDVGLRLKKAGWKGLFGIDAVMKEKTGKLYLVEINCRQPASTTYESQLQENIKTLKHHRRSPAVAGSSLRDKNIKTNYKLITTFEAHLMALLGMDLKKYKLVEIKDGAQVIQRITKKFKIQDSRLQKLSKEFNLIKYNNTEPNSDLLRIQSKTGIMKKHNKFNETGKKIVKYWKLP